MRRASAVFFFAVIILTTSCSLLNTPDNEAEFVIQNGSEAAVIDIRIERYDSIIGNFSILKDDSANMFITMGQDTITEITIYTLSPYADTLILDIEKDHRYVYTSLADNSYHLSIKHPD